MSVATWERALVAWLEAASGCTVRLANQAAPRPAYPYVTLQLGALTSLGMDEMSSRTVGDEVELRARGERILPVSVNVYAQQKGKAYDHEKSALAIAERIQRSLGLPSVTGELHEAGLSYVDTSGLQDLTWMQDTAPVERRQFDVRFGCAVIATETTEYIATVDVAQAEGGP